MDDTFFWSIDDYQIIIFFPYQNNGEHILWDHLEELYKQSQAESGLYIGRRLTYEHLHLTSYSKMKVNLAAQVKLYKLHAHLKFTLHNCNDNYQQVLSTSVACAFKLLKKEEYKETSRFCSMFN